VKEKCYNIAVMLCVCMRERERETFIAMMAQGLMITKGSNR